MKKKFLCVALAALMLTGCNFSNDKEENPVVTEAHTVTVTEEIPDETYEKEETAYTEDTTTFVSEETASEETESTETTESEITLRPEKTPAEKLSLFLSENSSDVIKTEGFTYKKPQRSEILKVMKGKTYIAMYADGSIEKVDEERIGAVENKYYKKAFEELLSEDYYNSLTPEYKEMLGLKSYEDYRKMVEETISENFKETYDLKPAVYFSFYDFVDYYSDDEKLSDEEEQLYALRTADFLFSRPFENKEIADAMANALKNGDDYFASVSGTYKGNNIISCNYVFSGFDGSDFSGEEEISADGAKGIILGDCFVPEDTEVLAISSRERDTLMFLAGDFIPDNCLIAAEREYTDAVYDIAEINRKLPELRKLYMYQAVLENADRLPEMTNLESLSYYPIESEGEYVKTINDAPFVSMKGLKELRLYGDYENYDFLSEMKGLEKVAVIMDYADKTRLDSVFSCPYITELYIKGRDIGDLSGIEKLEKLEILEIDGNLDARNISKLKNLSRLEITSIGKVSNLESIAGLKNLKELMLHSMDKNDLSFIGKMQSLEYLGLYYVNSSFEDDIGRLKNLKTLSLMDIEGRYKTDFLSGMDSLEVLTVFGDNVDLDGISKAKNLKSFGVMLCEFDDISELKNCINLETLIVYNCQSPFDAKWIEGTNLKTIDFTGADIKNFESIKTLDKIENLSFWFCNLSEAQVNDLRNSLKDCEIEVKEQ
ncbi:MAG: hypothetical protein IKL70_09455 [Oscillospiraceae bacterium]|nr:hypothetical protein [Oscillospiraceae bacterium]